MTFVSVGLGLSPEYETERTSAGGRPQGTEDTMRSGLWIACTSISLLAIGCGGGDDGAAEVVDEGPETRLESQPYELQPGDEKYFCYTMRLPEDAETVVTSFVPEYGTGTHHILFVETLKDEPDGMFECPVLFQTTWIPLYAGGVASSPLVLPEGAAVRLEPGKQLLMQLHLQNATSEPISAKTAMRMKLADPGVETTPAGIWGMDNRAIDIPPQAEKAETEMTCTADRDMDLYGVLGHMHKMGKEIEIVRGEGDSAETLASQAWSFADQPILPVDAHISKGDSLTLRCAHGNPTMKPIGYGESSDQEMCAVVFFYTPYDGLSGCLQLP